MNVFIEKHQKLLHKLKLEGVEFILVGGYAVIYHGYKRTTGDMDLWLKPTNENKLKLLEVLSKFGFDKQGLDHLGQLDFTKVLAFHFWTEPERVDCLTQIEGVTYEEADTLKEIANFEGLQIPVIHLQHLITNKIITARAKDKADVEELQKINRHKRK